MQLTFESLAELQDFVQWVQAARQAAPIVAAPRATIVVQDLPEVLTEVDGETPRERTAGELAQAEAEANKPARKRRTKAEMEAARTAETTNPISAESAEVAEASSDSKAPEQSAPAATTSEATSAPVDKGDSAEFIKSRLAERPEVSQVEHLNLARTFIGKHGMEKYNASFPLAGLTPNVMGYSPADCATHAAALDFLSLE